MVEITVGKIPDEKKIVIKKVIKKVEKKIAPARPKKKHVKHAKHIRKQPKPPITNKDVEEMLNVLKGNQKVIEDVVKINSQIIGRMIDLSTAVTALTENMNRFLSKKDFEEKPTDTSAEMDDKLTALEKRLSTLMNAFSEQKK